MESENGIEDSLQVPVFFTNDFDVDENGVSYLFTLVYVGDEGEPTEIRLPLDDVTDSICDQYGDVEGYKYLYLIAQELNRVAEVLREKAVTIEDSVSAVSDLFNIADD